MSTDVRDFLHRDVYPETERKIRRLFRKKFKTQKEFYAVETDVVSYLLDYIWEIEKEHIKARTQKGKRLKEKRIDCKMVRLRQIIFSEGVDETGDESVDETEMVPITQYMEIKKGYEDKLSAESVTLQLLTLFNLSLNDFLYASLGDNKMEIQKIESKNISLQTGTQCQEGNYS